MSLFRCPQRFERPGGRPKRKDQKRFDTEADHEVFSKKSKIFGYRGGTAEITSARQKKNLSEKSDAKIKQMMKISRGEYRPRRKLVGSEPMYKAQTVSK